MHDHTSLLRITHYRYQTEHFQLHCDRLTVEKKQFTTIQGSSGSGKTLLLKCILQHIDRDLQSGQIILTDENICQYSAKSIEQMRAHKLSYMPSNSTLALNPSLTCLQQITFLFSLNRQKPSHSILKLSQLLDIVELPEFFLKTKYPHQLSHGQLQRLLLVMALVKKPMLLLIDEPSSNLNHQLSKRMLIKIRDHVFSYGGSILMISHNSDEINTFSDAHYTLHQGVVSIGTKPSMLSNDTSISSKTSYIQHFSKPIAAINKEPLLKFSDVSITNHDTSDPSSNLLIKPFSQTIYDTETICILGESGCGKSSLAKAIAKFSPYQGLIQYNNTDIQHISSKAYHQQLQLVFQDSSNTFPQSIIVKNLLLDLLAQSSPHYSQKERSKVLHHMFGLFNLSSVFHENKITQIFSQGQLQRLAIIAHLITQPRVLILDEPTAHLDQYNAILMLNALQQLAPQSTKIIITHDPTVAKIYADRVWTIENNKLDVL